MRRFLCFFILVFSSSVWADHGVVPHEYESQGGYSLGFNNGGTVAGVGLGAVRANPAMLAAERKYELNGSYTWPGDGREVYRIGAVDSKTSVIAMGLLYTGHREGYKHWSQLDADKQKKAFYDSSVKRRIALGLAYNFQMFSIGINGEFVDGVNEKKKGTSGVTLGFGAAMTPLQSLRIGASVENLINEKVKEFAPRIYRVGASYNFYKMFTVNLDYVQRQRVPQERLYESYDKPSNSMKDLLAKDEKTAIISGSFLLKDLINFSVGYGQSFDKSERKSAAGSVSLVKNNFFLSYAIRRPYFSKENFNHTIHASYHVKL